PMSWSAWLQFPAWLRHWSESLARGELFVVVGPAATQERRDGTPHDISGRGRRPGRCIWPRSHSGSGASGRGRTDDHGSTAGGDGAAAACVVRWCRLVQFGDYLMVRDPLVPSGQGLPGRVLDDGLFVIFSGKFADGVQVGEERDGGEHDLPAIV